MDQSTLQTTLPDLTALHLEQALRLLEHSGRERPAGDPSSTDWMQSLIDSLVDLSSRDALTGLGNRRAFELALAREADRVARSGDTALLLTVDIDHFKSINDNWGHAAGDRVLKAVADELLDCVRPMDVVARIGGEEFAVILPNCGAATAEGVAERVRRRIERLPLTVAPRRLINLTVSLGGAFAPPWVRTSPQLWLERADQQLYRAKAAGRNRVQLEAMPQAVVTSDERRMLFDLGPSGDAGG